MMDTQQHSFTNEPLNQSQVLDLSAPDDRRFLRDLVRGVPALSILVEENLDDYLSLFPEPHWHTVYPSGTYYPLGMISFDAARNQGVNFDFHQMLKATKSLKGLSDCEGYEKLIAGFRNTRQAKSTLFEVLVAGWCAERTVTRAIEFSPVVAVRGHAKHPEFLWHTEVGAIYCECKQGKVTESKFSRRVNKLLQCLNSVYQGFQPWDPALRLDVKFDGITTNKIEARFKDVVAKAAEALRASAYADVIFEGQGVSAALRPRGEPPHEEGTMMAGMATVTSTPTNLADACDLSLTVSISRYRRTATGELIRDARSQLPKGGVGAIFLEFDATLADGGKVDSLLRQPTYENTPWVSLWDRGRLRAAHWRLGQPLDNRLLAEKEAG
jgi:hypothetical protein